VVHYFGAMLPAGTVFVAGAGGGIVAVASSPSPPSGLLGQAREEGSSWPDLKTG
jgi:hypothetical protein